jgi:polyhydroxybutyrate depolymerase
MARSLAWLLVTVWLASCSSLASQSASSQQSTDALASVGCTDGSEVDSEFHVSVDGQDRSAVVRFDPDARQPLPLVVAFHGYGDEGAAGMERDTGFSGGARAGSYIVAYPRALGDPAGWQFDETTDVDFVQALIRELEDRLCVDLRRVYATGMSHGGGMANVVACRLSESVAAAAIVAAVTGPNYGGSCDAERPVSMLAIHAAGDPTVPYLGGEVGGGSFADLPPVTPIEDWAAGWAERNGCAPDPQQDEVAAQVQRLSWTGCEATVTLYRVDVADHVWFGSDGDRRKRLDGSKVVMEFFNRQALPPAP